MTSSNDRDAIAIVGMSCRFAPDLLSPDALWDFLVDGGNAISEMPAKRWDPYLSNSQNATAILGRTTRRGSFLDDIEGFDAEFFGITPREAEYLDPQQRIVLELAWESLGDAGIPPLSLNGTNAGVFVSANSNDYGRRLLEDLSRTGAWAVNGTTFYGIANRISYFLDLHGPSLAVDTACAGSLTALHLARMSLESGESRVALVGGINIMASPALVVALDAAGATSADGRSKAFDVAANGYGRGEGAGMIVVKRLSDAIRDGDRIRALIRGSGVFQDGRSDGMMAPNGDAQERMLREVYERATIDPASVGYVEAHGTGTPLGDLAETQALARVLGADRPTDQPLLFGSLKANIGHVEAASGIAGVIKVVMAMERKQIPLSPHTEPNPTLNLEESGLRLVAETTAWKNGTNPRRGGVSSYGVGGTISHLILEEAPTVLARDSEAGTAVSTNGTTPKVVPISAASEAGLLALAGDIADRLERTPDLSLDSITHTLARRRSHLPVRAGILASSTPELASRLKSLAAEERSPGVIVGEASGQGHRAAVWVFSGHGAQWTGMGQQLLEQDSAFAACIDSIGDVFETEIGWTPREAIEGGGPWTTPAVQAVTFAMQVALAESWLARGMTPAAVIGHSVGEIAASVVAGCLDIQDGARFACQRAIALEDLVGQGAMVLVGMPFAEAAQRLKGRDDVVAAISASPYSTVLSGDANAVEAIASELQGEGLEARPVNTDIAFHSPQVEAARAEVASAAARLSAKAPSVPLYSTALADPRGDDLREGTYWETNLRSPVRFTDAVNAAVDDGHRVFLEVSSHPVVAHSIMECLHDRAVGNGVVASTLRRDKPEIETQLVGLATLHCAGVEVAWDEDGELIYLPAASWRHRPYWIFPETAVEGTGRGHDPDSHTLLGGFSTVATAPARQVWETYLDMSNRPYHQDHKVVGVETVPASVVLNSFVAAGSRGKDPVGLSDIVLRIPLAPYPPRIVQIVLEQNNVRLASRIQWDFDQSDSVDQDEEWLTHTTATIEPKPELSASTLEDIDLIRSRCTEEWTWDRVDTMFLNMGVEGYTFPWVVEELRRNDHEQLSVVTIDHTPKLHPSSWTAVIDGALTVSGVLVTKEGSDTLRTSSHIDGIAFKGDPPGRIVVHTTRSLSSPDTTVDVLVATDDGTVVLETKGLRYTEVQDRPGRAMATRDLVHEIGWEPIVAPSDDETIGQLVLIGDAAVTGPLSYQADQLSVPYQKLDSVSDLAEVSLDQSGAVVVAPAVQGVDETPEQAAERCAWTLIEATRHLAGRVSEGLDVGSVSPLRLWCVSQGVRDSQREAALAHTPLWGVSRITAGERPDLWGGLIDLSDEVDRSDAAAWQLMFDLVGSVGGNEEVLSLTPEGAAVARLRQIDRPSDGEPHQCSPAGTYLVSGGLGSFGTEVARQLVDLGARRLVLLGRRGLPPRSEWQKVNDPATQSRIDDLLALEARGVTVRALAVDVSDEEALNAGLEQCLTELPPIRGVVHAAGVVADALVEKTKIGDLQTTMTPKAKGAMVLHRMFPPGTLDFFVLFSSCGQLARLTGQASYAAANSFLDGLAAFRHASSGHTETTSLAWAQVLGVGMGETTASTTILEAESRGMAGISTAEAFRCWSFVERFRLPYAAIMRVLPDRSLAVFSELPDVVEPEEGGGGASGRFNWSAVDDEDLGAAVLIDIHEQVAAELNLMVDDIGIDRPLVELGVDSVMTVGLRVRLYRRFGIDLPPTILWSSPTVRALAEFLTNELRPKSAEEPETSVDAEVPVEVD